MLCPPTRGATDGPEPAGFDLLRGYIPYHGQKIRLSRNYFGFEDYKDDPDNIHPSENARVQKLVMEAKIEQCFEARMDVFVAVGDIAFPGYGCNDAVTRLGDGSTLMLLDVEIPRADAHRFFLFHERGGIYELVDDFVDRDGNPIRAVGESKEGIVYTRTGGDVMVRKPQRR